MHTIGSRRSEPFSSVRGTSSNSSGGHAGKLGINLHLNYPFASSNGFAQRQNRRRLEHTPYARTISVEDSWCSERSSEHDLSSDGEDEDKKSITSITSISLRNSHLRSTLNKAKQHLSFDKWRSNASGNNTSANSMMMPGQQNEILSPGESTPGGRLSRWFSIRRGSTQQYDFGGKDGRDSRASSCEIEDKAKQVPATVNGHKMPLLPEVRAVNFCRVLPICEIKILVFSRLAERRNRWGLLWWSTQWPWYGECDRRIKYKWFSSIVIHIARHTTARFVATRAETASHLRGNRAQRMLVCVHAAASSQCKCARQLIARNCVV